jgi:hypothetical protein
MKAVRDSTFCCCPSPQVCNDDRRETRSVQLFGDVHAHDNQHADSERARNVRALLDTSRHRRNDGREGIL